MNSRLITVILLLILAAVAGSAQTGSIRGKVIDGKTGEELIGTTVVITGTTTGTISDFDGNFSLDDLEPGTYSITVSYVSYDSQVFPDVVVRPGEVSLLNIQLNEAQLALEEVQVVARARRRTESAMQVLQRKSAVVLDGISSSQISKLGDSDAAAALRRVTGVNVEGGRYVYVRGLSDRYSQTTLNGAEIPGLDPNRNTVQMDLFPSNIIENMVIHKTFSPDLPGSFTGGHVDIITRDFPERRTFQFSTSTEYNPQVHLNNNFLLYPGGKLDWLGFDDGTRAIPEAARGDIPARYYDDARLTEITRSFNKIMEPERMRSFVDHSHSLSYGDQVKLFGKELGLEAGLSYSRKYHYSDNGQIGRYKLIAMDDPYLAGQLTLQEDTRGSEEVLWGSILTLNYKLSHNHKIGLLLLHNQSGESSARYQQGEKSSDESGLGYQTRSLQYLQRGFSSGQLRGEHVLPGLGNLKIDWFSSFTRSSQDEPDLRFFTNSYSISLGLYEVAPSLYPVPTRYYRNMEETNWDNKVHFQLPFDFFGRKSRLKFGGAFVYKERSFREQKFSFRENSNSYDNDIATYLADENMQSPDKIFVENSVSSNLKNSYDGNQSIAAAYVMVDMPVLAKLRMITGLRYEYTYMLTKSLLDTEEKGELDLADLLPSLNLTYSVSDRTNLRMAYNRTLARPSFREMAPFASFDFVGDFVYIGNASLKRTLVDNFDLRFETFLSSGEMISLSLFSKLFHDPIERSFNVRAANPELTVRNVDQARVNGLEAEIRKDLGFIPLLKDFSIGTNLTLVRSEVSIDPGELEAKRELVPDFPATRVMYGQAPYVVNAFLSYANDSSGLSMNVVFNTTGKQLSYINAKNVPDVYQQPRRQLDVNLSKRFGRITLRLSAKNLLNDPYWQSYHYNGIDYIFDRYQSGRNFGIGFSYQLH